MEDNEARIKSGITTNAIVIPKIQKMLTHKTKQQVSIFYFPFFINYHSFIDSYWYLLVPDKISILKHLLPDHDISKLKKIDIKNVL